MTKELDGLLDEIKKNGVEKAEAEAKIITDKAQEKADSIIKKAEEKAEALQQEAKKKADETEQYGKTALSQAARDVVLSVSESLRKLVEQIAAADTKDAMQTEDFSAVIADIIKIYAERTEDEQLQVLVDKEKQEALQKHLKARLSQELQKGVSLSAGPAAGFSIRVKDGRIEHDFTPAAVVEALTAFVNADLAELIKNTLNNKDA